jgi:acyl carrier protein
LVPAVVPSFFLLVDQIPFKPVSGKIDRQALKEIYSENLSQSVGKAKLRATQGKKVETRDPRDIRTRLDLQSIEESLVAMVAGELGIEDSEIPEDFAITPLADLGLRSLNVIRLANLVSTKFGISIPVSTLYKAVDIHQLAAELFGEEEEAAPSLTAEGDGGGGGREVAVIGLDCRYVEGGRWIGTRRKKEGEVEREETRGKGEVGRKKEGGG